MDSDEDPWQQVYNLIVEGHSRLGAGIERLDRRLDGIDTRLNGMELVAEERDGRYMAKFEDLSRLVAKRVLSKEASTTPPPIPPTPPAPRRKRAS